MNDQTQTAEAETDVTRRGFWSQAAAILIGALITLFPFAAGAVVMFDPLLRRRAAGAVPLKVGTLAELGEGTAPKQFKVIGPKVDAWSKSVEPLGAVYVRRKEEGSQELVAFNASCPHAGCFVDYAGKNFKCPCHNSAFRPDGSRVLVNPDGSPCPSPRDLDNLEVEVREGEEIWVKFQNFYAGKEEKIPIE